MKKVILTVAILAGGLSTFATTNNLCETQNMKVVLVDDFKEISINKLPSAVTNAVKDDFETATINKAYINKKGQYKLDLMVEGTTKTVFASKDGKWIDKDDLNEIDD